MSMFESPVTSNAATWLGWNCAVVVVASVPVLSAKLPVRGW